MEVQKDRWYTVEETAKLYGISKMALARRLNDGRLRSVQVGKQRRVVSGQAILDDLAAAERASKKRKGKVAS